MARSHTPATLAQRARRRLALKKGLFFHALVFVLVNGGLALLWALGAWHGGWRGQHGGARFVPLCGWALGLAGHATAVVLRLQGEGLLQTLLDREMAALQRRDSAAGR